MPAATLADLSGMTFVVVCVEVRDPGNAGAVIRVAHASGAEAVVCCEGTVDPFNPKTVRASAGSVLHVPVVVAGSGEEVLDALADHGLRRVAAVSRGGTPYGEVDLTSPLALVLGNEASGLPAAPRGTARRPRHHSHGGRCRVPQRVHRRRRVVLRVGTPAL